MLSEQLQAPYNKKINKIHRFGCKPVAELISYTDGTSCLINRITGDEEVFEEEKKDLAFSIAQSISEKYDLDNPITGGW